MNQEKKPHRKKVVILDLVLNYLTKEQAGELVGEIQGYFSEPLRILPVANNKHLKSLCQSTEKIHLLIIGKENQREIDSKNLSYLVNNSNDCLFLKDWSMNSLGGYAKKVSNAIKHSKYPLNIK